VLQHELAERRFSFPVERAILRPEVGRLEVDDPGR
jgi:hypothetical protein